MRSVNDHKVSKVMTQRVITASPEDGARQAFFRMREHHVRHLPVVDANDSLLGIISDRDLRRPNWVDEAMDIAHAYTLEDNVWVGDLMTPNPVTLRTYDRISKAITLLREHRFGALPVINKAGELVGIVSPIDLLGILDDLIVAGKS